MKLSTIVLTLASAGCVESLPVFSPVDAGRPPFSNVTQVAAAFTHTCAVQQGTLFCWGDNTYGQLGTGDVQPRLVPAPVDAGSGWVQVQTGYESTCARRADGSVWCWGDDTDGQLGLGTTPPALSPALVSLPAAAQTLALHFEHVCTLLQDASLWCWGFNVEGQLGLGDGYPGANHPAPVQVAAGTHWRSVDTGQGHTCGIQTDGSLWCWGRNTTGHLGLGTGAPIQVRTPTRVGTATDWSEVHATQNASCALKTDGSLWCWGIAYDAPAGTHEVDTPTQVNPALDWASVSMETFALCGLKQSGAQYCWGRNDEGELGTGDTVSLYTPTVIPGAFQGGAVGRFHRCAINPAGDVLCTGENVNGQLGLGDNSRRDVLTAVSTPP